MSLLEEKLGSWLTLSSPEKDGSCLSSHFRGLKKKGREMAKRVRQRWMPLVGVGCYYYFYLFFYFMPAADARHSGLNRAQHSCLLCIWATDRKEEGGEEREAEENKKKGKKGRE